MMTRPVFDDRPQLDMAVTPTGQTGQRYALVAKGVKRESYAGSQPVTGNEHRQRTGARGACRMD